LLLAAAVAVWFFALRRVNLGALGNWGLLGELPISWYIAVAVPLLLFLIHLRPPKSGSWFLGTLVAVAVLMLYGTAPLLEETPRFPWSYKHIGVARYIAENGTVDPAVDIYHRWPGFFAAAASLSEVSGVDISTLARGAELFFALVNAILVAALARTLTRDTGVVATSSLLFSLANYVGQGYFAPQAVGFTMSLTSVLVALRFLGAEPNALGVAVQRRVMLVVRGRDPARQNSLDTAVLSRKHHYERRVAMGVVLLLHAAVVVSHQLTPYIVLVGLVLVALLGRLRPFPLVIGLAAVTGLYLLPNLDFVIQKFGIFTGANPLENVALGSNTDPLLLEKRIRNQVSLGLMLLMLTLAGAGLVMLARRAVGQAVVVGCLLTSPAALLLSQNYGGEARHRVYLFMLPWVSYAAAYLIIGAANLRRSALRRIGTTFGWLAIGSIAAMFVTSNFGDEDIVYIPPLEVSGFEALYGAAEPGSVFVMAAQGSPTRLAASYPMTIAEDGTTPTLADAPGLNLDAIPSDGLAVRIAQFLDEMEPREPLLIFSARQYRYAEVYDAVGPRGLGRVEEAIMDSSSFEQVFDNGAVRAYRRSD
jgi:hypothetical protein